jgi:hypothetical protein
LKRVTDQLFDHASAVGSPIHIIAEKDEHTLVCMPLPPRIGLDLLKETLQQIEPPMNIAHCVEEITLRQSRTIQI